MSIFNHAWTNAGVGHTHSTAITMVDRKGKPWHRGNNYAAFPTSAFAVGPKNTINQSFADFVLDMNVIHGGAIARLFFDCF
jgi:hypothetical protein